MVDLTQSRSALERVYTPGRFGVSSGQPGVMISERRHLTLLHIEHRDDDAESPLTIATAVGFPLPRAGQIAEKDGRRVLWLGPSRSLIITSGSSADGLSDAIASSATNAAVNDISSSRIVLRLSGPDARDVLASGCPLDLHESVFKAGMTATTNIDHYTALLDCIDTNTIDVYVARGYGVSFWQWLIEAAEEFGGEVLASS